MIPSASIDDQELAVAAKLASVNNPAVAGGDNLSPVTGLDHKPSRLAAVLRFFTKCQHPPAVGGQRQLPLCLSKRHRRLDAARRKHSHAVGAWGEFGGRFPICNLLGRGGALFFLFAGGHFLFVSAKPGALGDLLV